MAANKTRGLRLDITKANDRTREPAADASVSTPYSSASYASNASTSQHTHTPSDQGLEPSHPDDDFVIKSENSPTTPLETLKGVPTPNYARKRARHGTNKDRSTSEETRKIRVNERSKTGCITCRNRKKKCDERKPFCLSCEKTNYECLGYQEKRPWKGGGRRGSQSDDDTPLQPYLQLPQHRSPSTLPAIEDSLDEELLLHYVDETSEKVSVNTEGSRNPWRDLILPIAKDDEGVMHFVLALAGSNWDKCRPDSTLRARYRFHEDAAVSHLVRRVHHVKPGTLESEPLVASIILHFLMEKNGSTETPNPQGCLKAARNFLQPADTDFWRFALEFYTQHEFSTTLTSLSRGPSRPTFYHLGRLQDLGAATSGGSMRPNFHILAGIVDASLMNLISRITELRDEIRQRQLSGQIPAVHYRRLAVAAQLDRELNDWKSCQPEGSAFSIAAELYRQAAKLYLLRTVRSSRSAESRASFASCVEYGLKCLDTLPATDRVQSGLLLPTFILGCGAFEKDHRVQLGKMLDRIKDYGGFDNVEAFRNVLSQVWQMMDAYDPQSWDWESVVHKMGHEALVA